MRENKKKLMVFSSEEEQKLRQLDSQIDNLMEVNKQAVKEENGKKCFIIKKVIRSTIKKEKDVKTYSKFNSMKQEKKQASMQSEIDNSELPLQLKQLLSGKSAKNCSFKINHTTSDKLDIEKSCTHNETVTVKDEDKNTNIIHFFTINICKNDTTFTEPNCPTESSTCPSNFGSLKALFENGLETNVHTPINSSKSLFFKSDSDSHAISHAHKKFAKRLEGVPKSRFFETNYKNTTECQNCSIFCDGTCDSSIKMPFASSDPISSLNNRMNVDNLYSLGGISTPSMSFNMDFNDNANFFANTTKTNKYPSYSTVESEDDFDVNMFYL
jgi:hypothetical protein